MALLLVVVNATGAQSSSVVRAASAAGFNVRAQVRSVTKPEAKTLEALPNVTLAEGSLEDASFLSNLFKDADSAWVNTTMLQGDEVKLGKEMALAAKNAGVKHYVYSTVADHSETSNGKWNVPVWASKYAVEEYIRTLDNFPSTFVYVGGYLENYNISRWVDIKTLEDGSILMSGKLDPHAKVPHLEVERDLGPAVVKILQDGPSKWHHKRIPLAFDNVSMEEIVKRFSEATGIKITYEQTVKELDLSNMMDNIYDICNVGCMYNWDCKVPEEARELNPNWHSLEDFAKNKWQKPDGTISSYQKEYIDYLKNKNSN